jgi:hypothetical protein
MKIRAVETIYLQNPRLNLLKSQRYLRIDDATVKDIIVASFSAVFLMMFLPKTEIRMHALFSVQSLSAIPIRIYRATKIR